MKSLWKYLKPYKKQLIVGPFFKLSEAVLELFIPIMMANVIDYGVNTKNTSYIFKMGLVMLVTVICGLLFAYVCQYSASIASQGFGIRMRSAVFEHITKLSFEQTEKYGTSSLITRITNDINIMQQGVAMFIRLFIRAPFITFGSIVMAMFIDIKMSLIFLGALPVFIASIALIMSRTLPMYKQVQEKTDKINTVMSENLSGVRVIRAFAKTEAEKERFNTANNEYEKIVTTAGKIAVILNPGTMLIMNLVNVLIIHFGAKSVFIGEMTQGEITAFLSYSSYIVTALVVLSTMIILWTKAIASSLRVAALLNMEPSIKDNQTQEVKETDAQTVLEFKNVSFSYNKNSENALSDINFAVKKGESIGIIGGTGAGKTTLIKLIERMYEPTEGQILVGGVPIEDYPSAQLRSKIGMVAQKAVLLTSTVAENIRQGKPDATDEEIIEALKTAQAYDFIKNKPNGINTKVSRGASNFSGGQKQRLSIARALVRKPEILILDDSSSALDYATDAALRKAIKEYAKDMTVINISQRISSIEHCDRILVLSQGEQLGFAPHDELLKAVDLYAGIYESQGERRKD